MPIYSSNNRLATLATRLLLYSSAPGTWPSLQRLWCDISTPLLSADSRETAAAAALKFVYLGNH